jgi:hypothetical protein
VSITSLIVLSLAVWRISTMLVDEEGPGDILVKLRWLIGIREVVTVEGEKVSRVIEVHGIIARLFRCVWCLSIWIALIFALFYAPDMWLTATFTLSGGALVVHKVINGTAK